jgi:hypothetical protein
MILDNTLVLSDGQAITADARSTNIIDLGAAGTAYGHSAAVRRDIGIGNTIPFLLTVTEDFNTLTTLTVIVQVDDDVAFGSAKEVAKRAFTLAELNARQPLSFPAEIPEGTDERYLSLYYDVGGSNPSTGKLTAAIVAGRQTNI